MKLFFLYVLYIPIQCNEILFTDDYYSESSDEEDHPFHTTSVESLESIGHSTGRAHTTSVESLESNGHSTGKAHILV